MNQRKNLTKVFPRTRKDYTLVRRGDIYYADLSHATIGSEQGGVRPVLIIQNDKGNLHSPTVIAAAITSQNKRGLPTHIELTDNSYGLAKNSTIMLEQIRTIDKTRLRAKIGHLDDEIMERVNEAIFISFGIDTDLLNHNKAPSENITATENIKTDEFETSAEVPAQNVKSDRSLKMRKHKSEITNKKTGKRRVHA